MHETTRRVSGHKHRTRRPEIPAKPPATPARQPGERIQLPHVPPALAAEIRQEVAKMQAAYLADTGEAMPSLDEMKAAAVVAGFTAGEAVAGEYTLHDLHEMTIATKKVEERRVAAIAAACHSASQTGRPSRRDRRHERSGRHEKPWSPAERALLESWKAANQNGRMSYMDFAAQTADVARLSTPDAKRGMTVKIARQIESLLARRRQQTHRRRRRRP
jgi:hypothetical protein